MAFVHRFQVQPDPVRRGAFDAHPSLKDLSAPLCDPYLFTTHRVALCGNTHGDYDLLRTVLDTQLALHCYTSLTWQHLPDRIAACQGEFDFVIVDTSALEDADAIVDFGFRLRQVVPRLPLVFLSQAVESNDFSCERRAICDVTLRMPASEPSILLGIQAAFANHAIYLDRDIRPI